MEKRPVDQFAAIVAAMVGIARNADIAPCPNLVQFILHAGLVALTAEQAEAMRADPRQIAAFRRIVGDLTAVLDDNSACEHAEHAGHAGHDDVRLHGDDNGDGDDGAPRKRVLH